METGVIEQVLTVEDPDWKPREHEKYYYKSHTHNEVAWVPDTKKYGYTFFIEPDDLMESVEPFDFSGAVDFQTAYLAGYLADKYDVGVEESIERANNRVKTSSEEVLRGTIDYPYHSVITRSSSVQISNGKAKYALYPVWILSTKYKDQNYLFAMNGQTGKFVGNVPLDGKKVFALAAGLTVGLGIIVYLIMSLLGLL